MPFAPAEAMARKQDASDNYLSSGPPQGNSKMEQARWPIGILGKEQGLGK